MIQLTVEQVHRILRDTSQGEGREVYLEAVTKALNEAVSPKEKT